MLSSIALNLNELPINDIFENEIPCDVKYIMFKISILKKSFDDMTVSEFMNSFIQFYKYLHDYSAYFNRYESYRNDILNAFSIYMSSKSFYDCYQNMEETYAELDK